MRNTFTTVKAVFVTLTAVVLIAILVMAWSLRDSSKPKDNTPVATTTPVSQVSPSDSFIRDAATSTYYTLDLTYPKSSASFLPEVYGYVETQKQEFLKNFDVLTHDDIQMMRLDQDPWNLIIKTEVHTSDKTVSYVIQSYSFTGGAHGITEVATFTYDKQGKGLALVDVLKTSADLYTKLSQKARAYFNKKFPQGDANTLNDGTTPEAQTFSNWYVTNSDVVFLFGQYTIGPYVLGIQEFPLSKKANGDLIQPAYR